MPCWKSGWFDRLLRVLALVLLCASAPAEAMVALTELRAERAEDGLFVSAQLRIELSRPVEEALLKGIPLYFVAEADVLRERWYWTDAQVASARRYMRVSYQPLMRRWRFNSSSEPLSNAGLGVSLGQQYESLSEAMAAVQRISRWKVADTDQLEAEGHQILRFRFRLDSSQLPRTFQIGTAGQADWALSIERRIDLTSEAAR